MRKMFEKPRDIMLYQERTEEQEFGRAKKAYRICSKCRAVYFTKSWHHIDAIDVAKIKKRSTLWVTRCPACQMIADHQYEGALTIKDIPKKFADELLHLIKAFSKRAYEKNCQHRLIAVTKESQDAWTVTTTENQLASKLAKKIKDVFDRVELKVAYSKQPDDVVRILVRFKPYLSLTPNKKH